MGEISAASVEQNSGIDHVAHAVSQMDEVTQQNASLVEEAAAAAQSLEEQASRLKDTVAVFRLGNQAVASAASRAPAPKAVTVSPRGVAPRASAAAAPAASSSASDWSSF